MYGYDDIGRPHPEPPPDYEPREPDDGELIRSGDDGYDDPHDTPARSPIQRIPPRPSAPSYESASTPEREYERLNEQRSQGSERTPKTPKQPKTGKITKQSKKAKQLSKRDKLIPDDVNDFPSALHFGCTVIFAAVFILVMIFLKVVIPVGGIIVGSIYYYDCEKLPVYLIVFGVTEIVFGSLGRFHKYFETEKDMNPCLKHCNPLKILWWIFWAAWLVVGVIWVLEAKKVPKADCEEVVFKFTQILVFTQVGIVGFFVALVLLMVFCWLTSVCGCGCDCGMEWMSFFFF